MIIRHNLSALNIYNVHNRNLTKQARTTEKLSSGLRINRAADDAAGLSISQKMRAKIRGLEQAQRNAQDGISLIQVADGALNEIQDCLQRIKELSTQAVNGIYSANDRHNIQLEINNLLSQIDKIANETKFNKIAMLDGTYETGGYSPSVKQKIINWLYGSWLNDAAIMIEDTLGFTLSPDTKLNIVFKSLGGMTVASMAGAYLGNELTLTVNTDFLGSSSEFFGSSGPSAGGFLVDRTITHELVHGYMMNNVSPYAKPPMWFREGLAEAVHGASDERYPEFEKSKALNINDVNNEIQDFDFIGGNYYYQAYTVGYIATSYLYNYLESQSPGSFKVMLGEMHESDETFEELVVKYTGKATYEDFINELKARAQAAADADKFNELFLMKYCNIDLTDGKADPLNGNDQYAPDVVLNYGSELAPAGPVGSVKMGSTTIQVNWGDELEASPPGAIVLQVGDKDSDTVSLSVKGASSSHLGVSGISVANAAGARQAISACDSAINRVSRIRAELGACQNGLEHLMNNISSTVLNTQTAESRISDANMAMEMMEFTKNNILLQSAQYLLAQANLAPNSVLNLFR